VNLTVFFFFTKFLFSRQFFNSMGVSQMMEADKDRQERFVALLSRHEPVIRATIRAGVQGHDHVDEVMQRVSIAAWRKFDTLTSPDGFAKWACVIARYEILKFRRGRVRDRLQFDDELVAKFTAESAEMVSMRSRRIAHLEGCLEELPDDRRELVLRAYQRGISSRDLAHEMGRKPDALYQLLRRIRVTLMLCVERRLKTEEKTS